RTSGRVELSAGRSDCRRVSRVPERAYSGRDMDGTTTKKAAAAAALALLALGGAIGPALAEDKAGLAAPAEPLGTGPDSELPRFVPSTEADAAFDTALAPCDDPAISAASQPLVAGGEVIPDGVAAWYGARVAGRKTASGERVDPSEYTAAHRTLPFGSRVRVTHNGRSVVVRINDRGPFHGYRVIDLSQRAAED